MLCNTVKPDLLLTPSIISSKKCETHNLQKKQKLKNEENVNRKTGSKTVLERRWSAITHATNFKRKKRNSSVDLPQRGTGKILKENNDKDVSKAEYVQVSKKEYEEIKNRVSAIEKRLSLELENVQSTIICDNIDKELNIIQNIQSAYEQTLVQTKPLSPGADQIAKRLSRELRIRTSEQKMIRSPSARKIGNIRRRSREFDKPNNKITKNQSFRYIEAKQTSSQLVRSISAANKGESFMNNPLDCLFKQAKFHDRYKTTHTCSSGTCVPFSSSEQFPEKETSDKSVLCNLDMLGSNEITFPSKLNNRNIDPFQNNAILLDSDVTYVNTISADNITTIYSAEAGNKDYCNIRELHEIKLVQGKDKTKHQNTFIVKKKPDLKQTVKNNEKSCTEVKRLSKSNKENDYIMEEYVLNRPTNHLENYTPKSVPHIKKPIVVKSPKRLCSTYQNHFRSTPMKVLTASNSYSPNIC